MYYIGSYCSEEKVEKMRTTAAVLTDADNVT